MIWYNNGQKLTGNQKLYRILYHLKISSSISTNKFVKKVYRLPSALSPTRIWYQGNENIYFPRSHGNLLNTNKIHVYIPTKPSDRTHLESVINNTQEKPHIIYKKIQS